MRAEISDARANYRRALLNLIAINNAVTELDKIVLKKEDMAQVKELRRQVRFLVVAASHYEEWCLEKLTDELKDKE